MKIGLISQEYPPETGKGGIGTQTYLKAHGLTELGHDVRVISRSVNGQRSDNEELGVRVIRVPSTPMPVYTELADWVTYSQHVAEELFSQNELDKFDILDFPEWACEGYVHLLNQSEWNRVPTVVHIHGPLVMLAHTLGWPSLDSEFYKVGSQMEAASLRHADAVFSSSVCSAEWCIKKYDLVGRRIPVMHSGIDTRLFYPRPVAKASNLTILFVGKLVRNKGVEDLLVAACQLSREFPDLRLRLVGGAEKEIVDSLTEAAAKQGLERMLEMPGYVDRQNLPDEFSRAHVFAAPSRYEGGPGFVYLEAMACGLPVIACSGSGVAEVVSNGQNGMLVAPDDTTGLVEALRCLLRDGAGRDAMGERAIDYVRENADSRACIRDIEEFYEQIIDSFKNSPWKQL